MTSHTAGNVTTQQETLCYNGGMVCSACGCNLKLQDDECPRCHQPRRPVKASAPTVAPSKQVPLLRQRHEVTAGKRVQAIIMATILGLILGSEWGFSWGYTLSYLLGLSGSVLVWCGALAGFATVATLVYNMVLWSEEATMVAQLKGTQRRICSGLFGGMAGMAAAFLPAFLYAWPRELDAVPLFAFGGVIGTILGMYWQYPINSLEAWEKKRAETTPLPVENIQKEGVAEIPLQRFCRQCGSQHSLQARFCPKCGQPIHQLPTA